MVLFYHGGCPKNRVFFSARLSAKSPQGVHKEYTNIGANRLKNSFWKALFVSIKCHHVRARVCICVHPVLISNTPIFGPKKPILKLVFDPFF